MDRLTAESRFQDMTIFSKMIETLKKSITLTSKLFPGFSFIILKIDGVRLRVQEDSLIGDLKEQLDERIALLADGHERVLNEHYKREGIW
ncbi:MAG: hypothetical protein WC827_01030 [Candidatus Paceibacterota bacterium]|jgi:hypothetical protein